MPAISVGDPSVTDIVVDCNQLHCERQFVHKLDFSNDR